MLLCNFSAITPLIFFSKHVENVWSALCGVFVAWEKGGHRWKRRKSKVGQCSLCPGQEEPCWPLWHVG